MMDPAYRDWVAEAREADMVAEAQRRGARLKRQGPEMIGPCPVCGGRDRFSIHTAKRVFHCRHAGRGGDVIEMVRYLDACDFRAACESLTGRPPPTGPGGTIDHGERARREAERRAQAEQAAREQDHYRERERRKAYAIWQAGQPAAGTPVEAYLAGRGIDLPAAAPLRFHPDAIFWQPVGGKPREIHRGPAMLAAIVRPGGRFAGCHITWIDSDRPGRKADISDPDSGEVLPAKKVRGSKTGCHIRLAVGDFPEVLVIGEGIETVLSVRQAFLGEADRLARMAFWSSVDLGNLGGRAAATVRHPSLTRTDRLGRKRAVKVPGPVPAAETRALMPPDAAPEIILLGDGDSDRFTTEMTLTRAAARWQREGRTIRVAWPRAGMDFNDLLLGETEAA